LANEWQPIPKIVDTEYSKTAEKINEDVEENKLKITLTNSKKPPKVRCELRKIQTSIWRRTKGYRPHRCI
jgi:hypothetical protein